MLTTEEESNEEVEAILRKFWEIEEVNCDKKLSTEEEMCETHFLNNYYRDETGRYVVRLPTKKDFELELGDSLLMARRRFYGLLQRLEKHPKLKQAYEQFMEEYQTLGHMDKIAMKEIKAPFYVLPHHAVFKTDSSTTKLRVVFDAAAKTTTGKSLNDVLLLGPTIQQELVDIILRFRTHKYVLTGDIEKMYRQVLMHPDDQHLQLILWKDAAGKHAIYKLNTITYGTKTAPYLATRAVKQLFDDEAPAEIRHIWDDVYVDDVLTGSDSKEELLQIRNKLQNLFIKGGMKIRKWASNCRETLEGVPEEDLELKIEDEAVVNQTIKALGIKWCPMQDIIKYTINAELKNKCTKRNVLSKIASTFDPLGLVSPVVIKAKIFMQLLWLHKLGWDDELTPDLKEKWVSLIEELPELEKLKVPRCVIVGTEIIEIHGFCDSSEAAYAAAIYIRSKGSDGYQTRLLCSKTKVTPLKKVTIPRLELCAAALLSKLVLLGETTRRMEKGKIFPTIRST
jgi:hypothetical protein